MFQNIGEMTLLFLRVLAALPHTWRQRQKVSDQLFEIGNASLLMVCVLSFFIGAVMAVQIGPSLVERGLASAVGGLVGFSIARELAPILMAVLIAGRLTPHCRARQSRTRIGVVQFGKYSQQGVKPDFT